MQLSIWSKGYFVVICNDIYKFLNKFVIDGRMLIFNIFAINFKTIKFN